MRETKESSRGIQVELSANWGALAGTKDCAQKE